MTLRVVGINTPLIVPIFSALGAFSLFALNTSGVALPLHLALVRFQKFLLLDGV